MIYDTLPMPIAIPSAVILWGLFALILWDERRRARVQASPSAAVVNPQPEAAQADSTAAAAAVR